MMPRKENKTLQNEMPGLLTGFLAEPLSDKVAGNSQTNHGRLQREMAVPLWRNPGVLLWTC